MKRNKARKKPSEVALKLSYAYLISLGLVILVAASNVVLMTRYIQDQQYDAKLINIAGRQRMLSQLVPSLSLWLKVDPTSKAKMTSLRTSRVRWVAVQKAFVHGDMLIGVEPTEGKILKNSKLALGLQHEILKHLEAFDRRMLTSGSGQKARVKLDSLQGAYLILAEEIVNGITQRSEYKLARLSRLQIWLFGLMILLVALEGVLIFAPAISKADLAVRKLELRNSFYEGLVSRLRKAKEAELVFDSLLKAREEKYRALVENASDLIYEVDYAGYFLYVNNVMLRKLGLEEEKVASTQYLSFVREDFVEPLKAFYQDTAKNGRVESYYEFPVLTRNGELIWVGQTGRCEFEPEGRLIKISFIARDLTSIKLIEAEKNKLKDLTDAIMRSSQQGIMFLESKEDAGAMAYTCTLANPTARKLLQMGDLGAEGLGFERILDGEVGRKVREMLDTAKLEKVPMETEVSLNGGIDETRWLKIGCVPLEGGITMTIGDITKAKIAQIEIGKQKAFYETILSNLPSDLAVFSPEHKYLYLNPKAVMNTELREWLIGKDDFDYAELKGNGPEIANNRRSLFELATSEKRLISWEDTTERDGQVETVLRWFKPVFDETGELNLVVGYGIDITERKKMEEALVKAQKDATSNARAKQMFLSTMSHEMRTPLNCVIGLSHLLLEDEPTKEQEENIRTMLFASGNLLNLINDLLDYTKIEEGKLVLENIVFDLPLLLLDIQKSFAPMAKTKAIGLELDIEPGTRNLVAGDPNRLTQIINNLVSNGIKFTEKGAVKIRCGLGTKGPEWVRIEVSDSGIGIKQGHLISIFDSFTQADADTTRKYGGTGLGLSISQKLAALLGSEITVESELEKGSKFWFEMQLGEPHAMPTKAEKSYFDEGLIGKLEGMRVLLVEDNEVNILVASKFLKKWGCLFDIAKNGAIGVEMANKNEYDLILMDLQMPVMDGLEATRQIRTSDNERLKKVPIVALTAGSQSELVLNLEDLGLNAFLTKPFAPTNLYQVLVEQAGVGKMGDIAAE